MAFWAIPLIIHFAPSDLPLSHEASLNWRVTAFVAVIALMTPLIFCLAPFAGTVRSALTERLRGEGRANTQGKRDRRIMSAAVILQFGLAFLLLTSAGLLLRSFIQASETNPGFQPNHLVSMRIALPTTTYKTPAQVATFFNRLLYRLSPLPGIRQVAAISDLPVDSSVNAIISIEGRGSKTERVDTLFCRSGALATLRIPLLKGRLFQPRDFVGKQHAVIITQGLAKRVWPHESPIGRRIKFGVNDPMNTQPWLTVIGVIEDVRATLTSQSPRLAIFTTPSDYTNAMDVLVRTSASPLSLASAMRHAVTQIDPDLPVGNIQTVDRILSKSLSPERFRTWLLGSFAMVAMLLATLGIAGLLAYNATQRMREFGIRVALGAGRRNLLGLVFRHSLWLSMTGVAIGFVASLGATRVLSALLYDTSPFDPATFGAVALILILVALGAAIVPAWRAMHVDPALALRAE